MSCSVFAEPATTVIDTRLSTVPVFGSPPVATIPAKTPVNVVTNKKLWCEVEHEDKRLWAKCFDLKFENPPERHEAESDSGGSSNVVHTIGIRGLDSSDLEAAEPSKEQFETLNGYAVDADTATSTAGEKGLQSRSIDYLTEDDSGESGSSEPEDSSE